jgi:isopentenyl-diphosphate delta-isomerase type 1
MDDFANLSLDQASEELFDVVNTEDEVIGVERRSVVHRRQLMHRAIHVFVSNSKAQLYLQKRSLTKDSSPGKWVSSCSGHVDSGEDYDTAALRELGEELGLFEPIEFVRVFKEPACDQTGQEFVWVYHCKSEGPFTLDPSESSEGRWVDPDDLDQWLRSSPDDFARSFIYLWEKYCSLNG